jgi:predicted phosphodiesterase
MLVAAACSSPAEPIAAPAPPAIPAPVARDAAVADAAPSAWSFVVISDLHLPNPKRAVIDQTIAAIVALKPRFVIVAGDHTNGNPTDTAHMVAASGSAWTAVTTALQPLRDAHIPVLPIAGNHDSYLAGHRKHYAAAFADLTAWAAPLDIHEHGGKQELARAPFSYAVDVDGVHLSLIYVASQALDKDVAAWLEADLASAAKARVRIVVSHVPWHTAITKPRQPFIDQLGGILAAGHADVYLAGHEHAVWDEDFGSIHEIHVGCISGVYNYGPTKDAMARAHCEPAAIAGKKDAKRCTMPHGGGAFTISCERKNRMLQHARATFTVVTVDGDRVEATPMVLDKDGKPAPFYLTARSP